MYWQCTGKVMADRYWSQMKSGQRIRVLISSPTLCEETDSWRTQTKPCVHQDPGERSVSPTRDWPRLACECPGVSGRGMGRLWPCCRGGGTGCSSACMGPFEGGLHYFHYLHHSLASSQTTGSERSPTHQQKIRLKIYWAWPHPSEQDPVSPSISFSHQEASISLLSLLIRGQT